MIEEKKETVYGIASKILLRLANTRNTPSTKAMLANLRNSVGRPMSQTVAVWSLMFENLPENFLGYDSALSGEESLSFEERAILTTLQFYAMHQQGNTESVLLDSSQDDGNRFRNNFGYALASLRTSEDNIAIDRRFNVMVTSESFDELTHHMRQMIKILKSKTMTKVDYAALAQDLFRFLRGDEESVRLRWSSAYYRYQPKEKGEESNE